MTPIRSVTMCAICVLKESGVEIPEGKSPEDYVLTQYVMPDPSMPPVPIESDDLLNQGILALYPEAKFDLGDKIPPVGGVIGTVRSIFKALGFNKPPAEVPQSQEIVQSRPKRSGLYGPSNARKKSE